MGDLRNRGNVGDLQQWIGRRLYPDQPRSRPHGATNDLEVGHVDKVVGQPPRPQNLAYEAPRAVVEVVRQQHVVAGRQALERGGNCRHA